MDSLEEIKILVQKKVNQNSSKIVLSYFQTLINKHQDFCGCNYCSLLSKYVALKKYKSRFNQRYNNYEHDYDGGQGVRDISIEREWLNNYQTLDWDIKRLKLKKDQLKKLN